MSSVVDLALHASKLSVARSRHPSARAFRLDHLDLPLVDRAEALTQVARTWDELHGLLSTGPGCLSDDAAHEALQVMTFALCHPIARAGLLFQLPQLIIAVRRFDGLRDGELHPFDDFGCMSQSEALVDAQAEVDGLLYPLVHGRPLRDACRRCRDLVPNVDDWRTQVGCELHQAARP